MSLRIFGLFLLLCRGVPLSAQPAVDPCLSAINIGSAERSAQYVAAVEDTLLCDENINSSYWHRFDGPFNTGDRIPRMPETCVEPNHCGTYSSIWMNGAHPTDENPGPIDVDVCAKTTSEECCGWTRKMKVIKCEGGYFAYKLPPVEECVRAYCFGDKYLCLPGQYWEATEESCIESLYPNMTRPVMSDPFISNVKTVKDLRGKDIEATLFSVNCTVGYTPTGLDDDAKFDVSFRTDDGRWIQNETLVSPNLVSTVSEKKLVGHLGTTITCHVSAFFEKYLSKSSPLVSNGHWFGIRPMSDTHNLSSNVILQEGQSLSFYLQATFPITLSWCYDNPTGRCYAALTFRVINGDQLSASDCTFNLSPLLDSKRNNLTISPAATIEQRKPPYIVQVQFGPGPKIPKSIFTGYQIQSILVEIEDKTPRPKCSSVGDPHITPFRSRIMYHSLTDVGDFYLLKLKNPGRTLEIQVRHKPCWTAVCNCGVIAREGNNILGINGCNSPKDPPLLMRYLRTSHPNQRDAFIKTLRSNRWQIVLPSGIQITVDYYAYNLIVWMNIELIGLNGEQYAGLCAEDTNQQNYMAFRVPEAKSFFHLNKEHQPNCDPEERVPACSCSGNFNISLCQKTLDSGSKMYKTEFAGVCSPNNPEEPAPSTRGKRDTEDTDEDVVIDDAVFHMPLTQRDLPQVNLQWPTANKGITKEQATEECNRAMRSTPAFDQCSQYINISTMLENCIMDIQIIEDFSGSSGYVSVIERDCVHEIQSNMAANSSDMQGNTKLLKALENVLSNVLCPSNCSGHGACVNGSCTCESGYKLADCSFVIGQQPVIQELSPKYASIRSSSATVLVSASGIDKDGNMDCRVTLDGGAGTPHVLNSKTDFIGGRLTCVVLSSPALLVSSAVHSISISISNDRVEYSDVISMYIYDSTCMTCTDAGLCTVETGLCLSGDNDACITKARHQGCSSLSAEQSSAISTGGIISTVLCCILILVAIGVGVHCLTRPKNKETGGAANKPEADQKRIYKKISPDNDAVTRA